MRTSKATIDAGRPFFVTFRQLVDATRDLHQYEKRWLDALHDVWKMGAPSPDSRILNPVGYDPRKKQAGNLEKRLVFPTALAQWINTVTAARGMPLSWRQCLNIASGHADLGLDFHDQPIFSVPGRQ